MLFGVVDKYMKNVLLRTVSVWSGLKDKSMGRLGVIKGAWYNIQNAVVTQMNEWANG